jgi:hypothetical protein
LHRVKRHHMAEVVYVFTEPLVINGRAYDVQVCGRSAGNIWEGWIEFEGTDGEVLRTARETTQPNRDDLVYWAGGLSITYLEGAYARALNPSVVGVPEVVATPHFDEPAPSVIAPEPVIPDRAVLDPYSVAEKGETLLRKELGALHPWRLRDVVRAYELADESVDLEVLTQAELIELIVAKVVA